MQKFKLNFFQRMRGYYLALRLESLAKRCHRLGYLSEGNDIITASHSIWRRTEEVESEP